jgi:hypothetical protein
LAVVGNDDFAVGFDSPLYGPEIRPQLADAGGVRFHL